jgi:hypothetical protein
VGEAINVKYSTLGGLPPLLARKPVLCGAVETSRDEPGLIPGQSPFARNTISLAHSCKYDEPGVNQLESLGSTLDLYIYNCAYIYDAWSLDAHICLFVRLAVLLDYLQR